MDEEVGKIRQELKVNLSVLKEEYHKPADEPRFKKQIERDERKIADLLLSLQEALEDLKAAGDDAATGRAKETKRWQVNYDFTLARLEAQIAYLFEYQSMLGQMRKQLPDLGPGQTGWRLGLAGRAQGRHAGQEAGQGFQQAFGCDHQGQSRYAVGSPCQAREKLTALGLEWQGTKSE